MPVRPPEGTRDARLLPEDDEAEPSPPSSGAYRRPTMELGADVYQRSTVPGVYPALTRERAIREAKAGPPPLRVPSSVRPPPASVRPPPVSVRPAPVSERPRSTRLTEPLAAHAPPGLVLPFEPPARSPSSPSTSFGPISAMTLHARASRWSVEGALPLLPRASRPSVRASVAGLVVALGVVGLVTLLARRSAALDPVSKTAAAVVAPVTATGTTPTAIPSAMASQVAPTATPPASASARAPGGKLPLKSTLPTEVTPPAAPAPAPAASSRAGHRLFDTEN